MAPPDYMLKITEAEQPGLDKRSVFALGVLQMWIYLHSFMEWTMSGEGAVSCPRKAFLDQPRRHLPAADDASNKD